MTPARTCQLSHAVRFVACTSDGSRVLAAANDGRYTVVNARLEITHEGELPSETGSLDLHPTADVFALASTSELVVATLSGRVLHRRRHRRWKSWEGGAVAFLGDGSRLLAICPTEGAAVVVLVLQSESGQVLSEQALDVPETSAFHLSRHPLGEMWGIWAEAGQDGQWTYWLSVDENRISIEEVRALSGDHGPVEFHPSGKEFLVAADGRLERYTFPHMRLAGRLERPDDNDDFSISGCVSYLGDGRALVADKQSWRAHVVHLGSMTIEDELFIEGHEPVPFAELYPDAKGDNRDLSTDLCGFRNLPGAGLMTVHGRPMHPQTVALLERTPLFSFSP